MLVGIFRKIVISRHNHILKYPLQIFYSHKNNYPIYKHVAITSTISNFI